MPLNYIDYNPLPPQPPHRIRRDCIHRVRDIDGNRFTLVELNDCEPEDGLVIRGHLSNRQVFEVFELANSMYLKGYEDGYEAMKDDFTTQIVDSIGDKTLEDTFRIMDLISEWQEQQKTGK